MFKELRTGTKLFILVGMFSILIAVAVYDLIADRVRAIDAIRRELVGEQYLATLRDVYAGVLAGQTLDPMRSRLAKDGTEILGALARAETDAAGRMRTAALAKALDESLRNLWTSEKAAATQVVSALEMIRVLALRIGDDSHLALGASLPSYHLANILIAKLPAYAAALGEAQALCQSGATPDDTSLPRPARVLILADLLRSTAQEIKEELENIYPRDGEGAVKPPLEAEFSAMQASLGPYLTSLAGTTIDRQATAVDMASSVVPAYANAVDATMRAWGAAQRELDRLLRERIDLLTQQLRRSLALIGGLGGLSILASIMTHRHIVRPLERLQGLADRVSQTKDYSLRVGHKSGDEIGQLTDAFNDMLRELSVARDLEAADRERLAQQSLELLINVTSVASAATSIPALASVCLDRICRTRDWPFGQVWYPDETGTVLRCSADSVHGKAEYEEFHELSLATPLRKGEGLPGRVWESGSVIWLSEAFGSEAEFPRLRGAQGAGFRSAFAFPATFEDKVTAIFEFMSSEVRPADRALMDAVEKLGGFLGEIGERKRAEAALRASEERWQSVFESTTLGIAMIDETLHHVTTNAAYKAMVGYSDEELARLTPMDLSVGEERDLAEKRLASLRRGEFKHLDIEKQYRRKDGDLIWVHNYASVVTDAGSKALIIGIISDVTESKRAKDALRDAQSEIARASRLTAMGQLTASIAHEINQPLQAIVSNGNAGLRWLKRNRIDEVGETLNQIISDGHRASRTIASVRAIFKKDEGDRAVVDINELILEVLQFLHGELEKRGVSLRTELGSDLPQPAVARVQIQQVILNLVMNAAEAMASVPDGGRKLTITSKRRDPDRVVVRVGDSGPGIGAEIAEKIFEPFFTTKSQGMGIGLAICRSIAEAHQGRLSVVPGDGPGASFEIALPVSRPGS
jgi:PAS domain S-box-containing protein